MNVQIWKRETQKRSINVNNKQTTIKKYRERRFQKSLKTRCLRCFGVGFIFERLVKDIT